MKRLLLLGLLIVAFVLAPFGRVEAAPADLPDQINYQGTLVNGDTKINQSVSMTFELFESETGGTAVWQENQNVDVTEGYFNVNLGRSNPLNVVEFDKQLFLQVTVGGGQPYARTPLTLVPYAGMAKAAVNADTATVALAIVDKGVTQDMLADGVMAIPMGDAGGDLEGQYPNPTIKPEAVLNNIPDGGITQNMLAPNVSTTPSGPASGDLTGTYPDPIIAPRAITAEKIGLGVVKPEHLDTDGAMEDYVLYMNEMGEVQWGPVPSPLNKLGHGTTEGQMVWWDNEAQAWAYSHNVAPQGGQMMTWNEEFGIPQWKDANFTLPITHNGPTEGQTAIDITKTDVNGGGVYISVPQTETNGQALKVMGGGDNVATAHIDRTTDGESSEGALLVTTNLTTLEGASYGAKFMTNTNADNGYMTTGVKVDNTVVGATANMLHKGLEVTTSADNGLAVAGHFVANNDNVDGWVSAGNPNPTGAVVIENTSGVAGKIALVTKGDIYWNSTAHGHNLEILNGIVMGEGANTIAIEAPTASTVLNFTENVNFAKDVNIDGAVTTTDFSISNNLTVGGNVSVTGNVSAADGNFTGTVNAVTGNYTGDINAVNGTFSGDITAVNVNATMFTGDLTGNVTGNVTGDVTGNLTGNVVAENVKLNKTTVDNTDPANPVTTVETTIELDAATGAINADAITVDNTLAVTGDASVGGNLTVTGNVTANEFYGTLKGDFNGKTIVLTQTNVDNTDPANPITTEVPFITLTGDTGTGVFGGDVTAPNFIGNLTGDVTGNVTGNVTGDLTGNVTGNVTGDVTGDLTGNVTGNVTGDLTGNVTGNVTGDLTGNVIGGTISGTTGTFTGNVSMADLTAAAGTFTADVTAPNFIGNLNGTATLTALTVNGNPIVNGNADLNGNIDVSGTLTAGNGQISTDLTVGQDMSVTNGDLQMTNGNVFVNQGNVNILKDEAELNITNGNINAEDLVITGTATIATGTVTTLTSDNATINTMLNAVAAQIGNLVITGADDATADLTANDVTVQDLTVNGALGLTGNLTVGTAPNQITLDATNGHVTANQFNGPVVGDVTGNVTGNVTGDLTGNVTGGTISGTTGTFTGNLSAVDGTFTGNVSAADITASGALNANGDLTVAGVFTANGTAVVADSPAAIDLDVNGEADFASTANFATTVTIQNSASPLDLQVIGEAQFDNNVTFNNPVFNTENVTFTADNGNTLTWDDTNGQAAITGTNGNVLTIVGDAADAGFAADMTVTGDLEVTRRLTVDDVQATGINMLGNFVAGGTTINNLGAYSSNQALSANTLQSTAGVTVGTDLAVGNNTTIGGTLNVTGATTLAGGVSGNTSFANNITVAGTSTLNGPVILGDAAADAITVNGTATLAQQVTLQNGANMTAGQFSATVANAAPTFNVTNTGGTAYQATVAAGFTGFAANATGAGAYAANMSADAGTAVLATTTTGTAVNAYSDGTGTALNVDADAASSSATAINVANGRVVYSSATVADVATLQATSATVISCSIAAAVTADLTAVELPQNPVDGQIIYLIMTNALPSNVLGVATAQNEVVSLVSMGGAWYRVD